VLPSHTIVLPQIALLAVFISAHVPHCTRQWIVRFLCDHQVARITGSLEHTAGTFQYTVVHYIPRHRGQVRSCALAQCRWAWLSLGYPYCVPCAGWLSLPLGWPSYQLIMDTQIEHHYGHPHPHIHLPMANLSVTCSHDQCSRPGVRSLVLVLVLVLVCAWVALEVRAQVPRVGAFVGVGVPRKRVGSVCKNQQRTQPLVNLDQDTTKTIPRTLGAARRWTAPVETRTVGKVLGSLRVKHGRR
jgi:hypothetical protein